MARRPGGKAASRKARQRYVPRTPRPTATPAPAPAERPAEAVEAAMTPTQSADSPRRSFAPRTSRPASALSSLTDRQRAEYHYVERDLRNIGILTVILVLLLVAAWAAFNALGVIG